MRAVCVLGCRHGSRILDQAAPFRGRAVLVGGDIGLTGLASGVFVVAAFRAI